MDTKEITADLSCTLAVGWPPKRWMAVVLHLRRLAINSCKTRDWHHWYHWHQCTDSESQKNNQNKQIIVFILNLKMNSLFSITNRLICKSQQIRRLLNGRDQWIVCQTRRELKLWQEKTLKLMYQRSRSFDAVKRPMEPRSVRQEWYGFDMLLFCLIFTISRFQEFQGRTVCFWPKTQRRVQWEQP